MQFEPCNGLVGVQVLCLVLGDVAHIADDLQQPSGLGLHQGLQVSAAVHPLGPKLGDFQLEQRNGGGFAVLQLVLHPAPAVLDVVEVCCPPWKSWALNWGRLFFSIHNFLCSDRKIWCGPV